MLVHQAAAVGGRGGLDPVVHAELGKDVRHVGARGLHANEQGLGDLRIGAPYAMSRSTSPPPPGEPILIGQRPGASCGGGGPLGEVQPCPAGEPVDLIS